MRSTLGVVLVLVLTMASLTPAVAASQQTVSDLQLDVWAPIQ
jgi:hypothetical protein